MIDYPPERDTDNTEATACDTPLIELLRNVPADARAEYEHSKFSHSNIPYGHLCHTAADKLETIESAFKDRVRVIEMQLKEKQELEAKLQAYTKVGALVDKIRYAMSPAIEAQYVRDLLKLFDSESGNLKE